MKRSAGQIFVLCLLGLLGFSTLCVFVIYWRIYGYGKLFGDFATFRAAAAAVLGHNLSAVYDADAARRLFAAGQMKEFAYFLNPPTGLFVVLPLGLLPPLPGLVAWTLAQLVLLGAALNTAYIRKLFAPANGGVNTQTLLFVTILAFCLQTILFGQLAALCTALFVLVLAWRRSHPVRAGIALGIFYFKPQLGILLPLLLLAENNWKVLGWAALTASLMVLFSLFLWGPGLWQDYRTLLALRTQFMAQDQSLLFVISDSVYAALRLLGCSASAALLGQAALAFALLFILWPVLRRGREIDKILILTLSAILMTPYVLLYDMALLALPAALMLREAESGNSTRLQLIALLLLILMPLLALLLQIAHIPYSVIAIGFALGVARRSASIHRETKPPCPPSC